MKTIYLAGGCFWGMEALLRSLPGVAEVTVGYANGDRPDHATYEAVCTGVTGFRETVRVDYDPETGSLEQLLFAFFAVVDVTKYNRQGADIGSQYQSGIYWTDGDTEETVRKIAALEAAAAPVFAVELKPLSCFYPAEDHHQRYLEKHPTGYCHISPLTRGAVARYPFSPKAYTQPAARLLEAFRQQ